MFIDPVFKGIFVTIIVLIIGTFGFFFSFLQPDSSGDVIVKQIKFRNSNFHIDIKKLKTSNKYVIQVFSDKTTIAQEINFWNDFGDSTLQVANIPNGFKISTKPSNSISFVTEVDDKKFASLKVKRRIDNKNAEIKDCIPFANGANWYGGQEHMDQKYPVQHFRYTDHPYVTTVENFSPVSERYWFSSRKFFILVDYESPLFIDQDADNMCFTAKKELPYYIHDNVLEFTYRIGVASSMKELHLKVINKFLGKPKGMPDDRVIRYPIWNTWVEYGKEVNEQNVADYAKNIVDRGFNYSLLDIDDRWEECYGSLAVDKTKFGNLKTISADLKSKGFILALWTHPFINTDCQPYFNEALEKNYLAKTHNGSTATSWWNSKTGGSSHVNFANPAATKWYIDRLEALRRDYGVETFKFDGGESSWYPLDTDFGVDPSMTPSQGVIGFVKMAAEFGNQLEIRTGWGTQNLHVLVRMLDTDSNWLDFNGIKGLIPKLFQFNFNGYDPFPIYSWWTNGCKYFPYNRKLVNTKFE